MEQPSARYNHAAVKTEGKEAYIFGGFDERRNRCLGDLHRYEYKSLKFSNNQYDKVGGSSWISVYDSGTKPAARRGHSMVHYRESVLLYGGMTNKGFDDENLYKYTIESRQWMVINVSGTKPGCRAFHSMSFYKADQLVIFGGKMKIEGEDVLNSSASNLSANKGMFYFVLCYFCIFKKNNKIRR